MGYQNINASLSADDIKAISDALDVIDKKLPFLITLTPSERKKLVKMGDKSLAFVQNALVAAKTNPGVIPSSFDIAEFESDVLLATAMSQVNTFFAQRASKSDDTTLAISSEAMEGALQVYDYIKAGARSTPGLKPVAAQLAARWTRNKSATKAADGANA